MSLRAVAKKDLRGVRRSRSLWTVATLLALLFALVAYGQEGYLTPPKAEAYQLFSMLSMLLGLLLPMVALLTSYMAIAGERESGGIKFLLGFPNTRRDVFLGKLASRLLVVGTGVSLMFVGASSVALTKHAVLPLITVLGLFALSVLYGSVFVSIAVALSASIAAKSRAIAAAIGSYFLFVLLFVVPGVRITLVVRWLHHTMLGFERNQNLYNAVSFLSPYVAFRKAANLVFPAELQTDVFRRAGESSAELPLYLTDEFAFVVFAVWLVVSLGIGYRRFERSDIE